MKADDTTIVIAAWTIYSLANAFGLPDKAKWVLAGLGIAITVYVCFIV